MGHECSITNNSEHNVHWSIHTVGKGFEVNSGTVNANSSGKMKFPQAVWYDVKFTANGKSTWVIGKYHTKSPCRVTWAAGNVYATWE